MAVGMFMAILDIQIVASSLPEIQAGLGLALDQLSWVQTAYLMAEIVAIPLTGWLTAMLSTRGAFLACVCGFTAASLACAGSTGFWSLIPARVVQGLLRRSADPAGFFCDLPDVRLVGADPGDIGCRPPGDAGADPRTELSADLSPTGFPGIGCF